MIQTLVPSGGASPFTRTEPGLTPALTAPDGAASCPRTEELFLAWPMALLSPAAALVSLPAASSGSSGFG